MTTDDLVVAALVRIESKVDKSLGRIAEVQVTAARHDEKIDSVKKELSAQALKVLCLERKYYFAQQERTFSRGKIAGVIAMGTVFIALVAQAARYIWPE